MNEKGAMLVELECGVLRFKRGSSYLFDINSGIMYLFFCRACTSG